jgi:hypothetical protein
MTILWAGSSLAQRKVKIKYKDHTQHDFTGSQVRGKLRTPAVFYIFKRKRTEGHKVARGPAHFDYHVNKTKKIIVNELEAK